MEAVERTTTGNQGATLRLERLPDRLLGPLRMLVRLGVGDALIQQPGVQFLKALHPQARREEPFPHQADLVLHLAFLPARSRGAGGRLHQIMAAHQGKAAIELPVLAQEDSLDRRLHIVVDAATAGALEEGEGPVMGIEHHLLGLARIDPHEQHPAMAQPDMGGLDRHRRAIDQHDLMAPIELVGLARRKAEGDIGRRRRPAALLVPGLGIAPDSIIAAVVSQPAQRLEQPDQREAFPRRLSVVGRQHLVQPIAPRPDLRQWLDVSAGAIIPH